MAGYFDNHYLITHFLKTHSEQQLENKRYYRGCQVKKNIIYKIDILYIILIIFTHHYLLHTYYLPINSFSFSRYIK